MDCIKCGYWLLFSVIYIHVISNNIFLYLYVEYYLVLCISIDLYVHPCMIHAIVWPLGSCVYIRQHKCPPLLYTQERLNSSILLMFSPTIADFKLKFNPTIPYIREEDFWLKFNLIVTACLIPHIKKENHNIEVMHGAFPGHVCDILS